MEKFKTYLIIGLGALFFIFKIRGMAKTVMFKRAFKKFLNEMEELLGESSKEVLEDSKETTEVINKALENLKAFEKDSDELTNKTKVELKEVEFENKSTTKILDLIEDLKEGEDKVRLEDLEIVKLKEREVKSNKAR